jgi:N-methylhydantoinase A/oxoprolinase/acetone carboxylase beta subunit
VKYGIGIDTGGTFTDSVIVDFESQRLVAKAKALTTRQDLKIGIQNSLSALDTSLFPQVKLVSLSTTLATNSVVEGKGSRVGLLVTAPNENSLRLPAKTPAQEVAVIRGAHDRKGNETVPLDLDVARQAVRRMKDQIDAFAVSGYFSIYNAAHELEIKALIAEECAHPVVCGHELSTSVGMIERAVTAALNARLLPVIEELLDAVIRILRKFEIQAPLMVVRGDGSLISERTARLRPVETVLSGPAASVTGACWLTGLNDAVVVDMGGTTTDIGVLSGGRACASDHGATIGGWRTRTRSLDIWTAGLGGDSRIRMNSADDVQVGPRRVVPLSLAAHQHQGFLDTLQEMAKATGPTLKDLDLDFFTLVRMPAFAVGNYERRMLASLDGCVLDRASVEREVGPAIDLKRFVNLGCVAEVSFTPTDLLHARGSLNLWETKACGAAVKFYQNKTGLDRGALLDRLFTAIIASLKLNLVAKLLADAGISVPSSESRPLLASLLGLNGYGDIAAHFQLAKPLVAVGAPVKAYFPRVAEELSARLIIPEHGEVANAAGAVTGRVIASAQIYVRPLRPVGFAAIAADKHHIFDDVEAATEYARQQASLLASRRAVEDGGKHIDTFVDVTETTAPLASGWGKTVLMERQIVATAVGRAFE